MLNGIKTTKELPKAMEQGEKAMTNADRIRAMTDKELADLFSGMCNNAESCDNCPMDGNCPGGSINSYWWERWLKQPAEEEPK